MIIIAGAYRSRPLDSKPNLPLAPLRRGINAQCPPSEGAYAYNVPLRRGQGEVEKTVWNGNLIV